MELYEIEIEENNGEFFILGKSYPTEALARHYLDYFRSDLYKTIKIRCYEADDDKVLYEYGKLLRTQNSSLFTESKDPIFIKKAETI